MVIGVIPLECVFCFSLLPFWGRRGGEGEEESVVR